MIASIANGVHKRTCLVFINGVKSDDCILADEEAGIAYCHKKNPDGTLVFSEADGAQFERIEGLIEVRRIVQE